MDSRRQHRSRSKCSTLRVAGSQPSELSSMSQTPAAARGTKFVKMVAEEAAAVAVAPVNKHLASWQIIWQVTFVF